MQTSFFYRFADWDEQISKGCKMQKKYKKKYAFTEAVEGK